MFLMFVFAHPTGLQSFRKKSLKKILCTQDYSVIKLLIIYFLFVQGSPIKLVSVGYNTVWCIDLDGHIVVRTEVITVILWLEHR